ncbi:MAG: DUF1993 domain-containing protein [Pseudomonadales bacterium]
MSISFYEASVGTYQQILASVAGVLDKGAAYLVENDIDPQDFVLAKLREDMMPLHFQVVSVCHHSLGALNGMREGRFAPPSFELDKSYAELQGMVTEAIDGVAAISETDAEAFADRSMVFALGKREMPFTNQNFLMSFSLPNFYFHATTTYDILRMKGVSLGKMDYLGQMRVG